MNINTLGSPYSPQVARKSPASETGGNFPDHARQQARNTRTKLLNSTTGFELLAGRKARLISSLGMVRMTYQPPYGSNPTL